jgi:geranylgeranyl pyrophosphate synthase
MDKLKSEFDYFLELFLTDNPQYIDVYEGGKRLRPIIVLEIASFLYPLWRTNQELAYKIRMFSLGLETIHCASLIIDDLPTMDNDMYRRGNLTFHTKYGRQSSYLMVYNLLTLIKNIIWDNDDQSIEYLEFEEIINNQMEKLILGQKYDLDSNWKPDEGSRTLKIAEYKTASLFKLAFLGPYYLLHKEIKNNKFKNFKINASEINLLYLKGKLGDLGLYLGMSFQLSDDMLDLDTDTDKNNYGLETSSKELKDKYNQYYNLIINELSDLNFDSNSSIYEILNLMNKRFL